MAFAPLTHTSKSYTDGGNNVTTSAIDTTGAALIAVVVGSYQAVARPTISDNKTGNVWHVLTDSEVVGQDRCTIVWCAPADVGGGHTFTATGTGDYPAVAVMAFSADGAGTVDQENGATANPNTTLATGSVTPSVDNEIVIAALVANQSTNTISGIDGGFTIGESLLGAAGAFTVGLAYLIQTAKTAANPTWTVGVSSQIAVRIATFQSATGGLLLMF